MSDGLASVRDGAYCRFDRTAVVSEYTPTGGLKVRIRQKIQNTLVNYD